MSRPEAICACSNRAMQRLNVGGLNRYYFCTECSRIREEICDSGGVIAYVRFHEIQGEDLPALVVEQARAILDQCRQLSLFEV
jgi:hypothetical protein